ncbi:MAG: hypothetical protein OXI74_02445, partial [Rhodospirillaceae bacterium]|nr:hypothetical protein [Rhodospirillaceae bacterium]
MLRFEQSRIYEFVVDRLSAQRILIAVSARRLKKRWIEHQMAGRRPIIEIRNVDKFFGEFQALNDVSLTVHAGER